MNARLLDPLTGAVILVFLAAGCGGEVRRPVFPARGQVTFEGQPIPNALVVLHPLDAPADFTERPVGNSDETGSFRLTTYDKDDGAPKAKYAATVTWSPAVRTPEGDVVPGDNRLPDRYAKATTSSLIVEIAEGGNDTVVLKLSK